MPGYSGSSAEDKNENFTNMLHMNSTSNKLNIIIMLLFINMLLMLYCKYKK